MSNFYSHEQLNDIKESYEIFERDGYICELNSALSGILNKNFCNFENEYRNLGFESKLKEGCKAYPACGWIYFAYDENRITKERAEQITDLLFEQFFNDFDNL